MSDTIYTKDGDAVQPMVIDNLGPGDLIKRTPDAKAVYVINHRNRATKGRKAEFSCSKWDDMNSEIFIKADKIVFVGFTF